MTVSVASYTSILTHGLVPNEGGGCLTTDVPDFVWDALNNRLGVGTGNPSFNVDNSGTLRAYGITLNIVTKIEDYTATGADDTILCDASEEGITVTLPAASTLSGKILKIKKIDSSESAINIDADGAETIDGNLTASLASQWDVKQIQSDGSNWFIIGGE